VVAGSRSAAQRPWPSTVLAVWVSNWVTTRGNNDGRPWILADLFSLADRLQWVSSTAFVVGFALLIAAVVAGPRRTD